MKINKPLREAFATPRDDQIIEGIVRYLGKVEPRDVFNLPAEQLKDMAGASMASARELGVTRQGAFNRYAYLWGLSDGLIAQTKEATDFIQFGGVNPNEQVQHLLRHTADALKTGKTTDGAS